ncbi:SDR family oxidoreductase [Flavobacterium notoginsengisoli]|uniref:SDR family oxidoreductase n=1 Tax=Flavobacterium notoginsengisoli TaxID=1478199 RepID=UPI0036335AC3
MKKAFITGANKGIGFESAKQLLQQGFYVYIGSRNFSNGLQAIEKLQTEGFTNVECIQIDVTDENSVKNARTELGKKTEILDVLINNAGINGIPQNTTEATADNFKKNYETNLFGAVRVTTAFIDLLKKSDEPRIVNVSSSMGSLTFHNDSTYHSYQHKSFAAYSSSKSALNMYTIHLAYELSNTAFKVNAVCPGYTKTDQTGFTGGDIQDAGARIVKYALLDQNGVTGKFISEELKTQTGEIPW